VKDDMFCPVCQVVKLPSIIALSFVENKLFVEIKTTGYLAVHEMK